MTSDQEQVDQRYQEWIKRFVSGGVDGGRNPDGTPKPAEIHFGDALVDDNGGPAPFSNTLPSDLSTHLSKAKEAYLTFGQSDLAKKKQLKLDFAKDFNFITLRAFRPSMRLDWQNHNFLLGSSRSDRTMVLNAVGSSRITTALPVRDGEGCDRIGNPFPDDKPLEGTRNYDVRKNLWDQYQAGTLSFDNYVISLRALFAGRDPDREPLMRFGATIDDNGADAQQCAYIEVKGWGKPDQAILVR